MFIPPFSSLHDESFSISFMWHITSNAVRKSKEIPPVTDPEFMILEIFSDIMDSDWASFWYSKERRNGPNINY